MRGRSKPKLRRLSGGKVQRNCRIMGVKDLSEQDLQELAEQESGLLDSADLMDPEHLTASIMEINEELLRMDIAAKRTRKGFTAHKVETTKLRIAVLKLRLELLKTCLAKTLPDKKSVTQEITHIEARSTDAIPDELLARAIAGALSEEEEGQLRLLFTEAGGERH